MTPDQHLPSGSQWTRVLRCPGSAVLAQVKDEPGPASERGTAIHDYLCDRLGGGLSPADALAKAPEAYRIDCAEIEHSMDKVRGGGAWHHEIALAYNVVTRQTRIIGHNIGRDYGPVAREEIPLSLDLARPGCVGDYKTGRGHDGYAPPTHRNGQLMVGAVAVWKLWGGDSVYAFLQKLDDGCKLDEVTWDAFDLESHADRIEATARAIWHMQDAHLRGIDPDVSEGTQCEYCPAKARCPAKVGLIRQWGNDSMSLPPLTGMSHDNVAVIYRRVRDVRKLTGKALGQLVDWSRANGPIDAGNGSVYGPHDVETDALNGSVVWDVVCEVLGQEHAKEAVELSSSKAAIKRAVRAYKTSGAAADKSMAEIERGIMAKVSERGGLTVKMGQKVEEYTP